DRSVEDRPAGILLTPFTVREARIRGLACTGRLREAADLAARPADASAPAPQWEAIEAATTGHVLLAAGDEAGGEEALERGLSVSVAHCLVPGSLEARNQRFGVR